MMHRPRAAAAGRRDRRRGSAQGARAARPAGQVTETVPSVVEVCVPPSLLLFVMSIEAQVAAVGIGGAKSAVGFVCSLNFVAFVNFEM